MEDSAIHLLQLAQRGYACSQIILLMGLEARGETNPGLVRAMAGLAYGCGAGRASCGALTGGCCLLALYAGKGSDEETGSEQLMAMLQDLSEWFVGRIGGPSGGIACEAIVGQEGPAASRQRCGTIVKETYDKVMEILYTYEFDLTGP
jgi:Putative redox-active protein (C_GCAxxG_C_C)